MLPSSFKVTQKLGVIVRRRFSAWEVVSKQSNHLIGRRTVVIAQNCTDADEVLGRRMQYELQKVGKEAGVFHCTEPTPGMDTILEATRYAMRTGVSSIVAIGPAGVMDTAKAVKFLVEQNCSELRYNLDTITSIPPSNSFVVPLLCFPTSYSYETAQPTVVSKIDSAPSTPLRYPCSVPDITYIDKELVLSAQQACSVLSRLDGAATAQLFHCVYIAKLIDSIFAIIFKMSSTDTGIDGKVLHDVLSSSLSTNALGLLHLNSSDGLHCPPVNTPALEIVASSLAQLSIQSRLRVGVNCRLSVLETTALIDYYNQIVPPKGSIIPYPIKILTGLNHYLSIAHEWREDGTSARTSSNVDDRIRDCSIMALETLGTLLRCTPDEVVQHVRQVSSSISQTTAHGTKREKSAISSLVEDAIAAEEDDIAIEKERRKSERKGNFAVDETHLQILKSDFIYDFAEQVM